MSKVSVVIPTHNRHQMLADAVASVCAQSYKNIEIVVVDDASTEPVDIKKLHPANGNIVKLIRHDTSRGGQASKNAGAKLASGEILAFLDDDDLYDSDYIATAVASIEKHPDIEVFFMRVKWFGENIGDIQNGQDEADQWVIQQGDGRKVDDKTFLFGKQLTSALLRRVPMSFQRPVLRQSVFKATGGYHEGCLLWDCDWAIRASMVAVCGYIDLPLYLQREQGQGFFSQPDRVRNQMLSNVEIKCRLLGETKVNENYQRYKNELREACAQSWFELSYFDCNVNKYFMATKNLYKSLLQKPSLKRCKFFLTIASKWLLRRKN